MYKREKGIKSKKDKKDGISNRLHKIRCVYK